MAHYEMKWNGSVYEVTKDGVPITTDRGYSKILDDLLAVAADTDTFTEGNGIITFAELRIEQAIMEARFKEE